MLRLMTVPVLVVVSAIVVVAGCRPEAGSGANSEKRSGGPVPGATPEATAGTGGAQPVVFKAKTAEIGCAGCVFGVEGLTGCPPAIRVDGKVLLLKGYRPASEHALCSGAKSVVVDGTAEGDTFLATRVEDVPPPK